jgi:rRNA maturation protein Nop10
MRQQKRIFFLGLMALIAWLMSVSSSAAARPQQAGAGEKNQPAALPAAKEELLGELSPQTEVPGPEITKRPWKEFWGTAKPEADYSFDPGSLRFAARAKQGQKWVLVVDGKERGTFDGIESVLVSPLGQHVVYSAKRDNKWVKMMDDKELGSAFDKLSGGFWLFGDAGLERHAYAAKRGDKWLMIADGKEGPKFKELGHPYFSRNGQRLVYRASPGKKKKWVMVVDGKVGPDFDEVGRAFFSSDGRRLAYRAKRGDKRELFILDGKEGAEFEAVGFPRFSPDGQHFAYRAIARSTQTDVGWFPWWVMVVDGEKGREFEEVSPPVFSPDGQHVAYRGKRLGDREIFVLDGKETMQSEYASKTETTETEEFDDVGQPVFSPDSRHWAYRARRGKKRELFILDGKEGPEFEEVTKPVFSPDSRRLAYFAKRGKKWRMVVDGAESEAEFSGSNWGGRVNSSSFPFFSDDSQHSAYVAADFGGTWKVVEVHDGKKTAEVKVQFGTWHQIVPFLEYAALSPDGQRLACIVGVGGQKFATGVTTRAERRVVVDGQVGENFDTLGIDLMFSPDGRHYVYMVRGGVGDNKSTVVIDGQRGKLYDDVIGGDFREKHEGSGPSSTALVYIAREGRKFYRVTQPLP